MSDAGRGFGRLRAARSAAVMTGRTTAMSACRRPPPPLQRLRSLSSAAAVGTSCSLVAAALGSGGPRRGKLRRGAPSVVRRRRSRSSPSRRRAACPARVGSSRAQLGWRRRRCRHRALGPRRSLGAAARSARHLLVGGAEIPAAPLRRAFNAGSTSGCLSALSRPAGQAFVAPWLGAVRLRGRRRRRELREERRELGLAAMTLRPLAAMTARRATPLLSFDCACLVPRRSIRDHLSPSRICVVNTCSVISAAVGRECDHSGRRGVSLPSERQIHRKVALCARDRQICGHANLSVVVRNAPRGLRVIPLWRCTQANLPVGSSD